jgi:hypothetical protein
MAKSNISTPAARRQYIHDLAEAARKIAKEEQERQANDKDVEFPYGFNAPNGSKRVQ